MPEKTANRLIHSSSPYLQQHAHNPVDWFPWSDEAFEMAKKRDVPVILSIGYSACHWCHVMEHESFENEELAQIMNERFVSIKVDREERPDVDQIYMEALQTMGLQGGWPLNVFITPDQKPFYGGTYFPPAQWRQVLQGVSNAYKENKSQLLESAEQFFNELNISELKRYGIAPSSGQPDLENLRKVTGLLKNKFDPEFGGTQKAPKFPMPGIWKYLLYVNSSLNDEEIASHLELTLDEMAKGGIYDQLGGGFARYSVDAKWFAPHFEKMLYDNGQLISLYAEAYRVYPKDLYKKVVYDSIAFLERELSDTSGGFYSALDADSEGKEGEYYVWRANELKEILGKDYDVVAEFYGITEGGNWEHGRNILYLKDTAENFARSKNIPENEWLEILGNANGLMLEKRQQRTKPGLDDKILAGWNGIALKGLADAYRTFGDESFLKLARQNAKFITSKMIEGKLLFRNYKNGAATIPGYLEDYAFVIDGLIGLYQATFEEKWLLTARDLADYALQFFYDEEEKMFFFTASNAEKLIARKKEIFDNVIPASNSQMANNLYLLSKYFYHDKYEQIASAMLANVEPFFNSDISYLPNWALLYYLKTSSTAEICFAGEKAKEWRAEMDRSPFFNKIFAGTTGTSQLPVLKDRNETGGESTIYVCFNKSCKLPVHSVQEAIKQINFEPA